MREVLSLAAGWARQERSFAMATLVGARGSAPRELGASMIVSVEGEVFGNVSGGCVEGAVFELCLEAIASGRARVETYGIADETALAVGLSCGGVIDVLVRPIAVRSEAAADLLLLAEREAAGVPTALALVIAGPEGPGGATILGRVDEVPPPVAAPAGTDTTGDPGASREHDLRAAASTGVAVVVGYDEAGCRVDQGIADAALLVLPFGAPPRLIIVGAVEFAVALSRLGIAMGMRVSVVDARPAFATSARFSGAEVVNEWPDRYLAGTAIDARTAICVLSHDARLDVDALRIALASPADYVGAMGSRRTHEDRLLRLHRAGIPAASIARLRSPIGLHLAGRTPEETALSILAEIVARRNGGTGRPLSEWSGSVHAAVAAIESAPATLAAG